MIGKGHSLALHCWGSMSLNSFVALELDFVFRLFTNDFEYIERRVSKISSNLIFQNEIRNISTSC
jgi:hypothetical protein